MSEKGTFPPATIISQLRGTCALFLMPSTLLLISTWYKRHFSYKSHSWLMRYICVCNKHPSSSWEVFWRNSTFLSLQQLTSQTDTIEIVLYFNLISSFSVFLLLPYSRLYTSGTTPHKGVGLQRVRKWGVGLGLKAICCHCPAYSSTNSSQSTSLSCFYICSPWIFPCHSQSLPPLNLLVLLRLVPSRLNFAFVTLCESSEWTGKNESDWGEARSTSTDKSWTLTSSCKPAVATSPAYKCPCCYWSLKYCTVSPCHRALQSPVLWPAVTSPSHHHAVEHFNWKVLQTHAN